MANGSGMKLGLRVVLWGGAAIAIFAALGLYWLTRPANIDWHRHRTRFE